MGCDKLEDICPPPRARSFLAPVVTLVACLPAQLVGSSDLSGKARYY